MLFCFVERFAICRHSRQTFAEKRIDGYLLLATREKDLDWNLGKIQKPHTRKPTSGYNLNNRFFPGIDSRIVRKKISSELLRVMKEEQGLPQSWHLKYRSMIPKMDHVYLAYDPQDVRLATNIREHLTQKGLQVGGCGWVDVIN